MEFTHFSLFSGIGGIDLAAEWANFRTVGQCELADYPYQVLCKHWPDVPKWRDIRDVTAESIREAGIGPIKLISAGYPCQPFSLAGKRKGERDDRHLWPEVYRLLKEVNPTWFIGENVAGHVTMGLDTVLSDLESINYSCQPFIIPACAVNAPHRRNRVFIVGHASGLRGQDFARNLGEAVQKYKEGRTVNAGEVQRDNNMAYTDCQGLPERNEPGSIATQKTRVIQGSKFIRAFTADGRQQWEIEPNVGRVANGISSRVDRLKGLGNAIVPQQVCPILKAIYEIEQNINNGSYFLNRNQVVE